MKLLKCIALTFLMINLYSCTSDKEDEPEEIADPVQVGEFNINYNNVPLILSDWKAERDGDYFRITASKYVSTGSNTSTLYNDIALFFHKDGTLITTSMYDLSISNSFDTSFYYSENTFDFVIEKIDEVNHTIKINFNGKIFDNNYNSYSHIGTPFKNVNGSVFMPYENLAPISLSFSKPETTMKVNGNDWRGRGQTFNQDIGDGFLIEINGDKEYNLDLVIPKNNIKIGTFYFNQNSDIFKLNSVSLLRYYPGKILPNEFVCTGSLNITEKAGGYIKGTFSFTANDPLTNENVSITNGVFNEKY
jgi:hypothetical protein